MILLIDNYDSFTYNVYQAVANLGHSLQVVRNDKITLDEIAGAHYDAIIISPGPGTPDDAGISKEVVTHFAGKLPILGICLGHQVIGEAFGAKVIRAPQLVHGMRGPSCGPATHAAADTVAEQLCVCVPAHQRRPDRSAAAVDLPLTRQR
jgi:anthranilate synthase/aminodeoxychorismate synthase-like glutamine amidotransferase